MTNDQLDHLADSANVVYSVEPGFAGCTVRTYQPPVLALAFDDASDAAAFMARLELAGSPFGHRIDPTNTRVVLEDRTTPASPEEVFELQLENFRREASEAASFYWVPRTINLMARDRAVLRTLNQAPLFWGIAEGGCRDALIVALGRIFDQGSPHNVDALLGSAASQPQIFAKAALEERKRRSGFTNPEDLRVYMAQVYEPTPEDFRALRRSIAEHRRLYETHVREIRHQYIAHREVVTPEAVGDLFSRAQLVEIERIVAFLPALHLALQELYQNGNAPELRPQALSIEEVLATPLDRMPRQTSAELATYHTRRCLAQLHSGTPPALGRAPR
jgi:hypothetical protein